MTQVDIVIPCYNYARYLRGCVESVLGQRDVSLRVLIIDDRSPDNTAEVASALAAADPRVSLMTNPVNLGLIGTANRGVMDWAKADYVLLLSADDLLTPGALARAVDLMDAHPEAVLCYGQALMLSDDGPALEVEDVRQAPFAVVPGKAFLRHVCTGSNPVPSPTALMRTSVQHRIGGYDKTFAHTSDLDMWMRAAAVGQVAVLNAVQGFYRWHSGNMSAAYHVRPVGDRREFIATCRAFEARFGGPFPEFAGWLREMERRFGFESLVDASKAFEQPGVEGWQEALAFAREIRPDYRSMPVWWKMQAKRLMGRRLAGALRTRAQGSRTAPAPWYSHGNKIGWWPEAAETAV